MLKLLEMPGVRGGGAGRQGRQREGLGGGSSRSPARKSRSSANFEGNFKNYEN